MRSFPILLFVLICLCAGCTKSKSSLSKLRDAKNMANEVRNDETANNHESTLGMLQSIRKTEKCDEEGYDVCLRLSIKIPEDDTPEYAAKYGEAFPTLLGFGTLKKSVIKAQFVDEAANQISANYTYLYAYESLISMEKDGQ